MNKFIFLILTICTIACNNSSTDSGIGDSTSPRRDSVKQEPYYPIKEYIAGQIAYVDSTPLAIEQITYLDNKKTDSVIIDRNTFKKLAAEFLEPDLNVASIKPLYEENSYNDLTINTITFNYTTKNKTLELQQADVLLNPENNKVKTVIFRKNRTSGDTAISLNGLWTNNMNFQLNYSYLLKDGKGFTKQVKIIWDRPMPED